MNDFTGDYAKNDAHINLHSDVGPEAAAVADLSSDRKPYTLQDILENRIDVYKALECHTAKDHSHKNTATKDDYPPVRNQEDSVARHYKPGDHNSYRHNDEDSAYTDNIPECKSRDNTVDSHTGHDHSEELSTPENHFPAYPIPSDSIEDSHSAQGKIQEDETREDLIHDDGNMEGHILKEHNLKKQKNPLITPILEGGVFTTSDSSVEDDIPQDQIREELNVHNDKTKNRNLLDHSQVDEKDCTTEDKTFKKVPKGYREVQDKKSSSCRTLSW